MKARVVLDTNFLMAPFQLGVDVFSELKRVMDEPFALCVFDKTVEELEKIAERGKGRDSRAARLALELLKSRDFELLKTADYADDAIAKISKEGKVYVATMDRELRKRCPRTIVIRQKRYLAIQER